MYVVNCRCRFAQETYRKVHPLTTNDREVFLYQFITAFDHEFNTDLVAKGNKIDLMKNIPTFEFDETDCAFDIKVKLLNNYLSTDAMLNNMLMKKKMRSSNNRFAM